MVKKRKPNIGEGIRKGDEEFGLGNEEIEIAQCSVCGAMGILGQTMTLNIEGKENTQSLLQEAENGLYLSI